jgi:hypothetical protein
MRFCQEESMIFPCISDASKKNASLSLSVTRLVHPRHQYGHISVTHLGNTRHKFYQWRVFFARVTDILLLVTHIVPRAWATTNQWRVSFTHVTNILIVTRFFSESLIETSLISFSGIVFGAAKYSYLYIIWTILWCLDITIDDLANYKHWKSTDCYSALKLAAHYYLSKMMGQLSLLT